MINDLYAYIDREMGARRMNQAELGKKCGHSQQVISKRLSQHKLDLNDLVTIFTLFDTDSETIVKFLKEKK